MTSSISIIGTGNVAWHLAKRFSEAGALVREIAGRNQEQAQFLAKEYNAIVTNDLSKLDNTSDLYIICITDDYIEEIAQQITHINKCVVHTSGATSLKVLEKSLSNTGVLYPLQTFKKNQLTDWKNIPICIEANNEENLVLIQQFAHLLSPIVHVISSEQRFTIHTAAVFVSNFVNYLFITAQDIVSKAAIPFSILTPLIREVAQKIETQNPLETQTGPAIRNDLNVQEKHLAHLSTEQKEIYVLLSKYIQERFSKEK